MTCDECGKLLDAHLDRELDARSSLEVEEHLLGCASCTAALQELASLQSLVRARAPRPELPAHLRRRLSGRAWPRRAVGVVALATAAAAVFMLAQRPAGNDLESALADAHVRALEPNHPPDVLSSDRHVVRPYFAGKLPYAVPAPDLAAQGFALLGGRLDVVNGQRVAALSYAHGAHTISVFLWPEAGTDQPPRRAPAVRGFTPVTWRAGGMRYWALSDAAPGELEALARAMASG